MGDLMNLYYDLHIHTALSPCGDEDMTPNNIVNMALLKGLDIIAITDHNSCENVQAIIEVAEKTSLLVIPGMEIETAEEVHVVTLFPNLEQAMAMQKIIYNTLPSVQNPKHIFGSQLIFNAKDEIIGENPQLLLTACALSLTEIFRMVQSLQGVAIPAHIDRSSYSILSNLGWFPQELYIPTIEVSMNSSYEKACTQYPDKKILQSSDAHYLGDIAEPLHTLNVESKTSQQVIQYLKFDT